MANAIYDRGRERFLKADNDSDGTIKLIFIDEADDTIDLVNDDFLDDRAAASRVATSGAFTSKTTTAGVFDADDVTVATVSGDPFESIDIFQDTGTESTSGFFCNIDTVTGLPFTPSGSDIQVQWDNGSNRIFKL